MQLPDLSLLLIVIVFWAVYWILRVFLFKPLGAILQGREAKTAAAQKALDEALSRHAGTLADVESRLTQARREAVAAREAARQKAGVRRTAALDEAKTKARAESAAALAVLDQSIAAAREELSRGVAAVASEIATGALGRKVEGSVTA